MTRKLYWEDSHLSSFEATLLGHQTIDGRTALILDQTAFYPTGGGQPCDTGRLGPFEIGEVTIDDQDQILHWIAATVPGADAPKVGDRLGGEVDWRRRREMMQQHTGQHILSQAFFQLFGAETAGFRITDRSTEIDLTLDGDAANLSESICQAEELANRIVFDNRPLRVHEVTPAEAARLPLRKESFITDCIRVVEIADFDWSPCGGTHARHTGEVGVIAIKSWERAKRMVRIHFLAGQRALADYRIANELTEGLARRFTVPREEIVGVLERQQEESKRLLRRNRELNQLVAEIEAGRLLESLPPAPSGYRQVVRIFDDRDFDEIKLLIHHLVAGERVLALLATRQDGMARLVFARSADLEIDVNRIMKQAVERLGGRGGGRPDFAQGGGDLHPDLEQILGGLNTSSPAC